MKTYTVETVYPQVFKHMTDLAFVNIKPGTVIEAEGKLYMYHGLDRKGSTTFAETVNLKLQPMDQLDTITVSMTFT